MVQPDHDKMYGVPTLEDLGRNSKDCGPSLFPGGEVEALKRMETMLERKVCADVIVTKNT